MLLDLELWLVPPVLLSLRLLRLLGGRGFCFLQLNALEGGDPESQKLVIIVI